MAIDGRNILRRLSISKKSDRERVSLYLSHGLYKEFKKNCDEISPSQVMEELMREFLNSLPKKNKK